MKLRVRLPEIEALIKQGVPRQVILNNLNENGITLSMQTFASTLKRLRKEVKSGKSKYFVKATRNTSPKSAGYIRRDQAEPTEKVTKVTLRENSHNTWVKAEE